MGAGEHNHEVYLVNFGLAKKFRDPKTHLHIPYKEHCPPTGTTSYVSINDHLGVEQSRCDDIKLLAYILLYFLHGSGMPFGLQPASRNTTKPPNEDEFNSQSLPCLPI
jgi:serine/threonine protein kinase